MDFKQYFLYQTDYQHWANDLLFNALDRLDNEARNSPQKLFFGSVHNNLDHLGFFHRKWSTRLRGDAHTLSYTGTAHTDWRELKNSLRQEIRSMQRWMERLPQDFFDSRVYYRHTLSQEERGIWVRDAFTHIFTYASLERGRISAIAGTLGAPSPNMAYYTYRTEMGEHLENMRKSESDNQTEGE
jgi:uncharacterized damage-inducible protein DinB